MVAACLGSVRNGCLGLGRSCKNCLWTADVRFSANAQTHADLTRLRLYDLAYRIAFLAFLAIEIAGFVLLAVAQKTPPPIHSLSGLYVCVGGIIALPIALCLIQSRVKNYLASLPIRLTEDQLHI